jgi:hypothetical protein
MKIATYVFGSHKHGESTSLRASDFIMALPQFGLDVAKTILAIKCRF